MNDDERRAELIEQKYKFLAEQEARQTAQQIAPTFVEPPIESLNERHRREIAEQSEAWDLARRARKRREAEALDAHKAVAIDWAQFVKSSIENAIAAESADVWTAIDDVVSAAQTMVNELERLGDEVDELKVKLAEARNETGEPGVRIVTAGERDQLQRLRTLGKTLSGLAS